MEYIISYKLFEDKVIIKQASNYKSLVDLRKEDTDLYNKVINNKLTNIIFPRTSKWNSKTIREEAKKYKNKSEFAKKSNGAYVRAVGLGILNKLFEN